MLAEYFATADHFLLLSGRADGKQPTVTEIKRTPQEVRAFVLSNMASANGTRAATRGTDADAIQAVDERAFHDFFGAFVRPILSSADEGDTIWVVPHDILHCVPLHAVAADGRCLIERNPVCYTPSAALMRQCHAKRKRRGENVLVIADPGESVEYPPEEALTVAELFHTRPYLNAVATKSFLQRKLEEEGDALDGLHLSCAAYFDPREPLQSGIQLAAEDDDGAHTAHDRRWRLTAAEILGLQLRVDLVTMSVCEPQTQTFTAALYWRTASCSSLRLISICCCTLLPS